MHRQPASKWPRLAQVRHCRGSHLRKTARSNFHVRERRAQERDKFMSPDEIRTLFDYNAWANRRSLDAAEKLTGEQFTRQMGSSFSSVRDTLAHIYGAEWIWLERFQGHSPSALPNASQFID